MLTSLKQMIGMPVVLRDRCVGHVERAVHDDNAHRLFGVVLRRGIGNAKWVSAKVIRMIGQSCVMIDQQPENVPDQNMPQLGHVFLTNGQPAGEVADALLQCDTLRILALEVCGGPLYRLMGRRAYAVAYRVRKTGAESGQVIVPELLSLAEMDKRWRKGDES